MSIARGCGAELPGEAACGIDYAMRGERGPQALLMAIALPLPAGPASAAEPAAPIAPILPGAVASFPAQVKVVGPTATGGTAPELVPFDLAAAMKGKPTVILYWAAEHEFATEVTKDLGAWIKGQPGLSLVSVVPPQARSTPAEVREKATRLGLTGPIVWDDEALTLANMLRVRTVPHIAFVDATGRLQLSGAMSLRHEVQPATTPPTPATTLAAYLERAARGGPAPTVAQLGLYRPVTEMIGRPFVDFTLNRVSENTSLRFSDQIAEGKLTLLVFWSVDCSHCKVELPILNDFYQRHQDKLNIVGVIRPGDTGLYQRTTDFVRLSNIRFPTVVDQGGKVWKDYKVQSTPTTLVVQPKGTIDTVLLGSDVNLDQELGPRMAALRRPTRPGA